jgi:hypothetical protein
VCSSDLLKYRPHDIRMLNNKNIFRENMGKNFIFDNVSVLKNKEILLRFSAEADGYAVADIQKKIAQSIVVQLKHLNQEKGQI